jgi:hypothetical protein
MSQQINLYNPAFEKQTTLFSFEAIAKSMLIIVLGAVALGVFVYQQTAKLDAHEKVVAERLKQREGRHDRMVALFEPRAKDPAIEAELASAEAELKSLRGVSAMLGRGETGNTRGYADYFKAFSRQNVQGLWLTGATIVGAGKEIELKGRAMQSELVPDFIGRLTKEPSMKGKTFDLLDINQVMQPVKTTAKDGYVSESTELAPYVEFSLQAVHLPEPVAAPAAAPGAAPVAAPVAPVPAPVAAAVPAGGAK